VVGGDVVAGPLPGEVLDALLDCGRPLRWVMGNGDREALAEGGLSAEHRDLVSSFEPVVAVDGVLFCHGTPRSDIEPITRISPAPRLERILRDVDERVVVCGHTHQQFDRRVDRWRIVNAGSVGMPYEGVAGAFWALVEDGAPSLRRTDYDVAAALERMPADAALREALLELPDPGEAAVFMESTA
jgi:diadenosine tetraphosphatase ApaH/serine/threonine PP2A family protein phosphatase